MNKKEAIAYAQITLDYMLSSKYKGELNPEALGIEMKQAFKKFTRESVQFIAKAQIDSSRKLRDEKNKKAGSDTNDK